jgi:hypothetical protein
LGMKAKKRANQFTVVVFIEELEEILW